MNLPHLVCDELSDEAAVCVAISSTSLPAPSRISTTAKSCLTPTNRDDARPNARAATGSSTSSKAITNRSESPPITATPNGAPHHLCTPAASLSPPRPAPRADLKPCPTTPSDNGGRL